MNNAIRPRRLFVSGGTQLSANAARLWRDLGSLLAMEDRLVVVTGGFLFDVDHPDGGSAGLADVDGIQPLLPSRGVPAEEHIETVLPSQDWHKLTRFKEGRIRVLQKRNAQSRRFSLVHSADVVTSIEGAHGTRSVLDVALAIDRPILPLPFGGG